MMGNESVYPQGWVGTNVGTVSAEIVSGSGFPKEYQGESTGDYPFAKVGDISRAFRAGQKHIDSADHFISEEVRGEIKARVFPEGAIVFPKIGEALKGNYRVVASREMLFDNNVMGIIPDTKLISGDCLYYFLTTQDFGKYAVATAVPSVRRGDIASISFSLPPLAEQHRIVAKIEELFSELDNGIESLETALAQLKVYRQALLQHAFEGKLTAQWREQNRDKLETADALLKRIQQERAQRYQQQLAYWEANGGSKPKATKSLPPLTAEDLVELPELPAGWGWFTMGDICLESILGKMLDKEKNKGELKPYLRNINVRWGKFDLNDLLEMRFEKSEYVRYGLVDGDLVICEGGEPGRCAVWRKEFGQDMQIQKALHRVRFTSSVNSSFVQMYFELCASNRRLEKMFTGTTIKHLTGEKLTRMAIPICSIDEQVQILLELESKFSEIDQLDQTITTSLQQAEALRQSILKKAFAGQLVPQDPHDEPASELLERIRAEREQSGKSTRERPIA